jgi:hypothetical protein
MSHRIRLHLVALGALAALSLLAVRAEAQTDPFSMYVDLNNCSLTRASWMAVAQENPGFGWQLAPENQAGMTFAAAMALLDATRIGSANFRNHCCPTTVYRDIPTGVMSIVLDNSLFPPPPSQQPAGPSGVCCEDSALFIGSDPLGCTVIPLASVPGATVVIGPTGPVSPTGPITIPTTPPTSVRGGGSTGSQPAGTYLGCFSDPNNPYNLDGYLERSADNTPQSCIATCQAQGFAYAGVEYGQSCLCGNSYDQFGPADNCDMPCTGDASQMCGGYNANNVYATGL